MTAARARLCAALLVAVCTSVLGLEPQTTELPHEVQLRKKTLRDELDKALETCTGSYSVTATRDTKVTVSEVKVTRGGVCRNIADGKFEKGTGKIRVESSLHVAKKSDDYVTNITWTYSPKDGTIPGRFVVALDFVDKQTYVDLDRVCLVFKMNKKKSIGKNESLMFHLDCVPLVNTPEVLMYVQIWSILMDKFSPQCSRKRREVSSDRTSNVCGTVECSDEMNIPISKSSHLGDICACFRERHGNPVLTWTHDMANRKFSISFTYIPPYLEGVEIYIVNSNTTEYHEILKKPDIVFGPNSLMATSNRAYPTGNYSVVLSGKCPRESLSHYHFCSRQEEVHVQSRKYIIVEEPVLPPQSAPADVVTIGTVVGGVVLAAIITASVFFYIKCRRKKSNLRSNELEQFSTELVEMPPTSLNNTNGHVTGTADDQEDIAETELTAHEEGKRSELTQREPLLSDSQSNKDRDDKYEAGNKDGSENLDPLYGHGTIPTQHSSQTRAGNNDGCENCSPSFGHRTIPTENRCQTRAGSNDESENLGPPFGHRTIPTENSCMKRAGNNDGSANPVHFFGHRTIPTEYMCRTRAVKRVLGLSCPERDDYVFCAKEKRLLQEMRRNGLMFDHVSQNTFAKRTVHSTEHTDIVIIVSKGMNEQCFRYLREPEYLPKKRDHDNSLIIVLSELQRAKVGEYVVRLVSLDHDRVEGERLLSEFRGILGYPQRPEGLFIYDYNFHGNEINFHREDPFDDLIYKLLT